eukprot:3529421-Lingulodinium_polyedra.AAC.1
MPKIALARWHGSCATDHGWDSGHPASESVPEQPEPLNTSTVCTSETERSTTFKGAVATGIAWASA